LEVLWKDALALLAWGMAILTLATDRSILPIVLAGTV
jgi:hypothetical protein